MSERIEDTIRAQFPDAVVESSDSHGVPSLRLQPAALKGVCELLKSKGFDYLADVTAVDWQDRIEVLYQLTAIESNNKVTLRVNLDRANPVVDSVTSVWRGAEYQEREVYDLMGVKFTGHPDLRRILLPEDWEGYPLRKDYVIPD